MSCFMWAFLWLFCFSGGSQIGWKWILESGMSQRRKKCSPFFTNLTFFYVGIHSSPGFSFMSFQIHHWTLQSPDILVSSVRISLRYDEAPILDPGGGHFLLDALASLDLKLWITFSNIPLAHLQTFRLFSFTPSVTTVALNRKNKINAMIMYWQTSPLLFSPTINF